MLERARLPGELGVELTQRLGRRARDEAPELDVPPEERPGGLESPRAVEELVGERVLLAAEEARRVDEDVDLVLALR